MTTIIIVVVVALVFFVTVCVVTFMVWKREAEMRTDSIRAIENNLERLEERWSDSAEVSYRENNKNNQVAYRLEDDPGPVHYQPHRSAEMRRSRNHDPFGWVRDTYSETPSAQDVGIAAHETIEVPDFAAVNDFSNPEGQAVQEDADYQEEFAATQQGNQPQVHQSDELGALMEESYDEEESFDQMVDFDSIELDIPELEELITIVEQAKKMVNSMPEDGEEASSDQSNEPETASLEEAAEEEMIENNDQKHDEMQEIVLPDVNLLRQEDKRQSLAEGYDIGRSGKKYTAEELEMLIKE